MDIIIGHAMDQTRRYQPARVVGRVEVTELKVRAAMGSKTAARMSAVQALRKKRFKALTVLVVT